MNKFFSFITLVLTALLFLPFDAASKPVTPEQARKVATTFLKGVGCKQPDRLTDHSSDIPFQQFYLFAADEGGFVLVSADDCAMPIWGYSATNTFSTQDFPDHIASWLNGYENEIAQCASLAKHNADVAQQWDMLLTGQIPEAKRETAVEPLMETKWNQASLYNNLCPEDPNGPSGHALAGCTAVAIAQVMKYWSFPSTGFGSCTYNSGYGTLSATFDTTTYLWSEMPKRITTSTTQAKINAIATILYHVGVAIQTNYGPNFSVADIFNHTSLDYPSAENALRDFFKYKGSLHTVFRNDYAPTDFANLLYAEIDAERPLVFSGTDPVYGGHAFVLDGYDSIGNFHVNWGWGGTCNGYFAIGAFNPSSVEFYNNDNFALIGIEPNYDFDETMVTTATASANDSSIGTVAGSGSYSFGSEVTLLANATEGCRFVQWSDGYKANPRQFIASGGDYQFTAIFEPLTGDTLSYATSNFCLTATHDDTGHNYWGIRLPATTLTPGHSLTSVQLYVTQVGNHTLSIYQGNTTSSPTAEKTFSVGNSDLNTWKSITLDSPVTIKGDKDVFITFYYTGSGDPIALTFDCGNDDGFIGDASFISYRPYMYFAPMIRGIFALDTNSYTISALPNDESMGSVSGNGTYPAATQVTLTATPNAGFFFNGWSDGVTINPRTLVVTENLELTAYFSNDSIGINTIESTTLTLYPNPTTGVVRINMADVLSATVFDRLGRQLRTFHHTNEVDLTDFTPGLYTLRIQLPQGYVVKKIIKSE